MTLAKIWIRPEQSAKSIERLVREWPKRTAKMRVQLAYLAAHYVYQQVWGKIPNKKEYAGYKGSLTVSRIGGVDAYAVWADTRSRRVRKVDARKTVLYVRPKKRSTRRTPPEILVLESFNPWTASTLPFHPSKKHAVVISRRASKRVVNKLSEQKRRERRLWEPELRKAGVRKIRKDADVKIPKGLEALPEVALDAMRLEFGLGTAARAHWRPAISRLKKSGIKQIIQTSGLAQAFNHPGFTGWRKWPTKTRGKISVGKAKDFLAFQKKLGV